MEICSALDFTTTNLVHWYSRNQESYATTCDEPSNEEHANIDRASTERSTNNKHQSTELNRTKSSPFVGRPGTDNSSDSRSSSVDTIESSDEIARPVVARLACLSEAHVDVKASLSDSTAYDGHAIATCCAAEGDGDNHEHIEAIGY